jgi:hypothetical protein
MKIEGSELAFEIMLEYKREKRFKRFIKKQKENEKRLKEKGLLKNNG